MDIFAQAPPATGRARLTIGTPDGLLIEAATDPSAPVLAEFFRGYDLAFVLPNEKEDFAGFQSCLALNAPPAYGALCSQYGPFREVVMVVRERTAAGVIGGANFIAYPLRTASGWLLSIALNYVFVDGTQRRRGYLRRLVAALPQVAAAFFEAPVQKMATQIVFEQNSPFRMSPAAEQQDQRVSGLDQRQRVRIWARLGARMLDFPYVQPPLSARQGADNTLMLCVLAPQGNAMEAGLLHDHLRRFFAISIFKGGPWNDDGGARRQLDALQAMAAADTPVGLIDPILWLRSGGGGAAAASSGKADVGPSQENTP